MDQQKTGALIRALRQEAGLTQLQLATPLGVSDRAVSKWERGLGCPDVSLLGPLAGLLRVPVERLLNAEAAEQTSNGGTMRQLQFYFCPECGNLLTATGPASMSCCGRTLSPLKAQKPDAAHTLTLEPVEDEWFVTAPHPMTKEHYIPFAAVVGGDSALVVKRWPEWDFEARFPRKCHGFLYWYCTQHGLFRQVI